MKLLRIGDAAPNFRATAVGGEFGEGKEISLSDFRGKAVALYFYPKDDTPGCTKQACELRDSWGDFATRATIFGVSPDSARSHGKFIAKFDLPFPLLADPDQSIVKAYGVWVEKSLYGKKYMGTERSTFVIDAAGKIGAILHKVKPELHVELLDQAIRDLGGK